jgi:UDP-N-acetylmuramate dehydrogenase
MAGERVDLRREIRFEELLKENVRLAEFTTLGIGGAARYFAQAATTDEVAAGVSYARAQGLRLFVLGGGSNIVVADEGFPGLVLRVFIRGIESRFDRDQVTVTSGAGESWDPFVAGCVERGWAGLECLSGIPGSVGATPIQNVGAYGQETSQSLAQVEALDLKTGDVTQISNDDCQFGYRTSRFKTRDRDRFIITRVTYSLTPNGKPAIGYSELERYLAMQAAAAASLSEVREAVIAIRRRKAMVADARDADSRSVGSFFVNPIVTRDELEHVLERAARFINDPESMPIFPVSGDRVKLSAAWLIERAGITRGYVYGNVGTSTKHALAITNRGGGTAREILGLAELIKTRVREAFDVELTPEPVFVGFDQ